MKNKTILLREPEEDDVRILFEWRNHEATRAEFRESDEVSWDEHVEWFTKTLRGGFSGRILRIAETEGERVGVVRGDLREDGLYVLSYTIAPTWRGQGLGKRMVVQFAREFLAGKRLAADVKKGNVASEKIAQALGLVPAREVPQKTGGVMVEWR